MDVAVQYGTSTGKVCIHVSDLVDLMLLGMVSIQPARAVLSLDFSTGQAVSKI